MTNVTVSLPDQAGVALKVAPEDFGGELLLAAAMKLFELGRLSAGAAAELAGVPKPVFLSKQAESGVNAFRQTPEDLKEELGNA